jgi:gluconate 5-dehydrogenase
MRMTMVVFDERVRMDRYEGHGVLITGSSRGIGFAFAEGYLREGAFVMLNGRDAVSLEAARAELETRHPDATDRIRTATFDVTDETAVELAVAALPAIDVLVNNAGVQLRAPLLEMGVAEWRAVVDIDLVGAFIVARAIAPGMLARGSGNIINICSVQSSIVRPTTSPYAAAKAGLVGLTKAMCAEWAPLGLRVNGIAPGYIATELNAALTGDPEFSSWIEARTPARRWGTEDDLVGPALWLASDEARFVNGQIIYVDGGMTAVI